MGKKSILNQRYCYKITSSFLKRNGYDLKLDDIKKGMKDRNIVGIGDSEAYRAIRRITHSPYDEDYINHIKEDIAVIEKKNKIGKVDHRKLLQLREEKRVASLEPNICNVICESDKQYDYLSKNGFKINGKQYTLLLGTAGGIKNNTVMFCTKEIYDKLYEFILNGADMRVPMIPSKLMAYMALTFSSSTPVTNTNKILVVKDVETQFKAPVTYIKWDDDEEEPSVEQLNYYDVVLNASDGCGLCTPELAKLWSRDLQLDYDCPAFCVRNSWVKGMLTAFDFKKYCKEVIGKEEVVDVWGKTHNINDIDIIMNESMLKFWKAYKSIDEYVYNCNKNGYTFSVTKYVHDDIDKKRRLNYQYLQCLDLSDEDIHNLLYDDIQEIKDVLGLDYRKTILFGKGENLTDKNVWNTGTRNDNHIKALMVDGRAINDDYVSNKVRRNIAKRIKQLKTGKIAVEGNYQIIIGEPIIQLENMFGLESKGLLKENEYYIEYWRKQGINKVGGFRSPMSCRSNARVANVSYNEEAVKWYGHLEGLIIFNAWDTSMMAYNGADFDGDILFTTSNQIIINGISDEPAIVCEGKSSDKKGNVNKDDFIKCIKNSFGNKVGSVTNVGSSFYDKISLFEKGTKEYDELNYRIQTIQYIQQECIDSAKNGIPPRPIPSTWTDNRAVVKIEDKEKRELYERIVTERKPYYFIYIYESLLKEHNKYDKATKNKCERLFRCDINTLKQKQKYMMRKNDLTKEENNLLCEINEFLYWYEKKQIVSNNPCIVNKIAKIVEDEFDDNKQKTINKEFDYSIYMSDNDEITDRNTIIKIKKAYEDYKNDMKDSRLLTRKSNDLEELEHEHSERDDYFKEKVMSIIPDKQILLNTMLELSYKKTVISKTLTWVVCGDIILDNMLDRTNNKIQYPIKVDDSDFEYNGIGYRMKKLELRGNR